ncbi:nitroreductase/quinone reductase family protein [Nocardia sp. IFM 10818]
MTDTAYPLRDLTKWVAATITRRRVHPRLIRAGGALHRALFRFTRGAGPLGADTLILTTRGRSSGRPRSTPLYYARSGELLYIAASFAGSDAPPQWFRNLVADPEVEVETAGERRACVARVLTDEQAQTVWPRLAAIYPPFTRYRTRTRRTIPVIELRPVGATRHVS